MTATATDPRLALHAACSILSDADPDRAGEQNGIGWNGTDSQFGHVLSGKQPLTWTPRMTEIAVKMLNKYTKQLARAGFDITTIPSPAAYAETSARTFAAQAEAVLAQRGRFWRVDFDDVRREFIIATPYDPNLVSEIRALPGRMWNPTGDKTNRVPALTTAHAAAVMAFAQAHDMAVSPTAQQEHDDIMADTAMEVAKVETDVRASSAAASDFEVPGLGGTLRPFQRAGVEYIAQHDTRVLVADDMGLGKTVEALAAIQIALAADPSSRAVIVTPASLKLNWTREAIKWLPGLVTLEGDLTLIGRWGRRRIRGITILNGKREIDLKIADGSKATLTCNDLRARILILNYDILDKHMPMLMKLKAQGLLKIVVFDESHYAKNIKAQRTKLSIELADGVPARLCLTGTPIMNRPKELISQLNILGRMDDFGGFHAFVRKYCQVEYTGDHAADPAGLLDLNRALRASCMVRRRKQDVLTELPPKVRVPIPVDITNRDEYERAERELIEYIRDRAAKDKSFRASLEGMTDEEMDAAMSEHANDKAERASRAEVLVRIGTLKQIAARGMLPAIIEWTEDFLESEKLVMFGWHQEIVHTIASRFHAPMIVGGQSLAKRDEGVDRFQTDPDTRLIVGNIKAGGVGLTLTAASNVAMTELGWNAATMDQAEDRCHRIGQTDSVTAWYFIAQGTIYEDIAELIESKRKVAEASVDGIIAAKVAGQSILGDLVDRLMGER